jgi:AraC-like DNA-binding protein
MGQVSLRVPERFLDPISDICSWLDVEDVEAGQLQMEGSWAIRVPAGRGVTFCASLKGSYWLSVDGVDAPVRMEEGDCCLIADGRSHRVGSDPPTEATDDHVAPTQGEILMSGSTGVVSQQASGRTSTLIGARFVFSGAKANPVLDLLPPMIHVRANSESASVLRSMLHVVAGETTAPKLGAAVMTNHLAHILLVQALRAYLAYEERPRGWLGALADSKIGAAMALMHRDVARRWSVDDLAATVGMSRSSFALRFRMLIGQAPLDYWLQVRMRRAGQLLRNSSKTVASVAYAWGYESEKSFGKAFKRVMGSPPSSYRKTHTARRIDTDRHQVA